MHYPTLPDLWGTEVPVLLFPALFGHTAVLQALLSAKSDVNAQSSNEMSPLFGAAVRGNVDATEVLLSAKADPDTRAIYWSFSIGDTTPALHAACVELQSESVRRLVEERASHLQICQKRGFA